MNGCEGGVESGVIQAAAAAEERRDPDRMPEDVETAIRALERLNSWARAKNGVPYPPPREAIYEMKRQAILKAHQLGHARHDWVATIAKCHGCYGTGRYQDQEGHEYPDCRKCGSEGQKILYFVQTAITTYRNWYSPLVTWHTPEDRWRSRDIPAPTNLPFPTRWKPNQEGQALAPGEAAQLLCIAEAAFPHRPGKRYVDYGDYGREVNDFAYNLHVGSTDHTRCSLCGGEIAPEDQRSRGGFGCSRGRIRWRDHACQSCVDGYKRPVQKAPPRYGEPPTRRLDIFDAFPLPAALLADPRIQLWMERHPAPEPVKKQEASPL